MKKRDAGQIKRAVVFIPSTIAGGAARKYNKEFIQFLHYCHGLTI
jgi:four helix bundle protein